MNVGNDLEARPSRRNEAPTVNVVDEFPNHLWLISVKILRSVRSKWKKTTLRIKRQRNDQ